MLGSIEIWQGLPTVDIDILNQERNALNVLGMSILGGWAVLNILVFAILYYRWQGNKQYFAQMNVFWNLVNLGLAASGLWNALYPTAINSLAMTISELHNIQLILLFNAGLDIAYIMTGFFLREKSINTLKKPERLLGYGQSLWLQGGFLLVFDIWLFLAHRAQGEWLFH